ncbi:C-terminal binding protein [Vibrio sp. DNB22_10_4]
MKKVVILGTGYANYEPESNVLADIEHEIVELPPHTPRDQVIENLKEANAVLVRQSEIESEMYDVMGECEIIVRYGVGLDNIDLEKAKSKGIKVSNIPDYGADIAVAEHAIALMFGCARRLSKRDADVKSGKWDIGQDEPLLSFEGKTLGVVGYGSIAKSFIRKTSGLGFEKVLVCDPTLSVAQAEADGVVQSNIEELAKNCDYVSIHAPLLPSTKDMFNAQTFDLMKPTAIVINTGRGGIINEDDLYEALINGKIFAAGLDTFEAEPVEKNNKLLRLDSTICTDHTAWYTIETVSTLQSLAAQEAKRAFQGKPLKNWVNP